MEDLELGSLLKKAREEKGLSLADIQEETKIREKYLRAIEKNEFDLLPAKVYLKVFIKGYAREVGLDYQELLKKYEVLNIEEKKESNLEKDYLGGTKVPTRTKKKNKFGFLKIILISLLIIVLAAVGIYTYQYLNNSEIRLLNQKNNSANTLEENSQVLEVEDSKKEQTKTKSEIKDLDAKEKADSVFLKNEKEDKMDSLKNLNSDQIKNDSTIAENELDQLENLKTDAQTEISITEPNPKQKEKKIEKDENQLKENESSALENNTKTEININNESKFAKKIETKVNLAAAEKVWLQVSLDGNRVFSGILAKDTKKEYNFKDRLYLKIGNGSALKVKIGDKSYGPWAAKGEIAEIEFLKKEEEIVVNNLRK